MKKTWKNLLLGMLFILTMTLYGCGEAEPDPADGLSIFYVNNETTQVIPVSYELAAKDQDTLAQVTELITAMTADTEELDYVSAIPAGVDLQTYVLRDDVLVLYFDAEYDEMDPVTEILCRLALVRTFSQLSGVSGVELYVDGAPLKDSRGDEVGVLRLDSFVENPGEQINSINRANLTLYFASEDGQGLVRETQVVYYNSNIAMERVAMERLLAGPKTEGVLRTIPAETKIMSVTTADGVCYVSLDTGFQNQNYEIPEAIVIYSIVDSLTSISYIDRVQISINGDTAGTYRDSFELSKLYESDLSYVTTRIKSGNP